MADFNYRDLMDLFAKSEFDGPDAPAPKLESQLGKQLGGKGVTGEESAYGKVYESLENPDRVFKIVHGQKGDFNNEMNMMMDAALKEQTAVPFPYSAEFYPDSKGSSIGMGVIEMEKRDLGPKRHSTIGWHERKAEFKKAQELAQLYQAGIAHQDNHIGNIRYNPQQDRVDIIDLGLSEPADDTNYTRRAENVRKGLRNSGDLDAARMYEGLLADANAVGHFAHKGKTGEAARDIVRQGEEVLGMTDGTLRPATIPEPQRRNAGDPGPVVFRSSTPPPITPDIGSATIEAMHADLNGLRYEGLLTENRKPLKGKFNPPMISPGRIKSGIQGGIGFGLADVIPSAEVIRTGSEQGLRKAGEQFVQEAAMGLPMGAAAGGISALAPAAAPAIGVMGGGLLMSEGVRSLNEATRALTGETALSKIRQTIGTQERTGGATKGGSLKERFAEEQERILNPPTITPTVKRYGKGGSRGPVNSTPMPDVAHRLRLAGDRFNPMRGEFGLSELLLGR